VVKIKVKNLMWDRRSAYAFDIPEFLEFEGDAAAPKWLSKDQMALRVDDLDVPIRVFDKNSILEIDGVKQTAKIDAAKPEVKLVHGSKGKVYEVVAGHSCTCPGFTFRGTCKHLELA
jgi:hypothetical protein